MKKLISSIIITTLSLNVLYISAQELPSNPEDQSQDNQQVETQLTTYTSDVELTLSLNEYPSQTAYEVVLEQLEQQQKTFEELEKLTFTSNSSINDNELKMILDVAINLKELNMKDATHSVVSASSPYSGHKSLEVIHAPGNSSSANTQFKMKGYWFVNMPNLKYIDISSARAISNDAFANSKNVETVVLSTTYNAITIGIRAFSGLANLSSINLEGVESVELSAFENAGINNGFVANFGESLQYLNNSAFRASGITEINFPTTRRYSVGSTVFQNLKHLKSIDLSYANIDGKLILTESNIEKLILPNIPFTATSSSFMGTRYVNEISNTENIKSFERIAFSGIGSKVKPKDIVNLNFNLLSIPSDYVFMDSIFSHSNIQSITFAPDVKNITIGSQMFIHSKLLTSFDFSHVSHIDNSAFYGTGLENIHLDDITMDQNAFTSISSFDKVVIDENTTFGVSSFSSTDIKELQIKSDIKTSLQLFEHNRFKSLDISPIKHFATYTFSGGSLLNILFFEKDTLNTTVDVDAFEGIKAVVFIHDDENQDYLETAVLENSTNVSVYRYSDDIKKYTMYKGDQDALELEALSNINLDINLSPTWYKDGVKLTNDKKINFKSPTDEDAGLYTLKLKSKHHDEEFIVAQYDVTVSEPTQTIEFDISALKDKYFKNESLNTNGLKVYTYTNGKDETITSDYTLSIEDGSLLSTTGDIEVVVTLNSDETVKNSFIIQVADIMPDTINLKVSESYDYDSIVDGVVLNTTEVSDTVVKVEQTSNHNHSIEGLSVNTILLTYTFGTSERVVSINVEEVIRTFEINTDNILKEYFKDDALNLDGLEVNVFENGEFVGPTTEYTTSIQDHALLDDAGTHTVTVTLNEDPTIQASFSIDVSDVLPQEIKLEIDEVFSFDFKVNSVTVTMANGFTEVIDMTQTTRTINNHNFRALQAGDVVLTYTMGQSSKTATFIVAEDNEEEVIVDPAQPEEPELPEIPETPGKPITPETPEKPVIPETPETPEKPVIPETPEKPGIPEIPEKPVTPEKPSVELPEDETKEPEIDDKELTIVEIDKRPVTEVDNNSESKLPNTGINSNHIEYTTVIVGCIALLLILKRRKSTIV